MMKISSVCLPILLAFLIMEEVLGKLCYQTRLDPLNECLKKKDKRKFIECWQNVPVDLGKAESSLDCLRATFILEDDTKLVLSAGYNTSAAEDDCKTIISHFKKVLQDGQGLKVKDDKCYHCHEDRCNANEEQNEKKKEKLRCYYTDIDSCLVKTLEKKLGNSARENVNENTPENARKIADDQEKALEEAYVSCLSAAETKQKGNCELCATIIIKTHNNQKVGEAVCGSRKLAACRDMPPSKEIQIIGAPIYKSKKCIPCEYDLCNDLEKQGLSKNEARNQLVSKSTVIIFILSILLCLMF